MVHIHAWKSWPQKKRRCTRTGLCRSFSSVVFPLRTTDGAAVTLPHTFAFFKGGEVPRVIPLTPLLPFSEPSIGLALLRKPPCWAA